MSFRRFSRRLAQSRTTSGGARVVVRSVDSTNALARRVALAYRAQDQRPPPMAFVAYEQTHGRGRGAHSWESPPGEGIYATLLLPAVDRKRLGALPLLAGLALARAARALVGRETALRWPNDLLVGGRKLGGVLLEAMGPARGEAVVIAGFGVNYGRPPIARATSILAERADSSEVDPEALADAAARLIDEMETELARPDDLAAAARRYAAASIHRRGDRLRCRTPAGTVEGLFCGFDERGFLRLETPEGERSMGAAELLWSGGAL